MHLSNRTHNANATHIHGSRIGKRLQKGKPHIQQALYQRYYRKMFGLVLRYSDHRADAEDILQEGFVKVFRNIGKFREEGSLEGWVRRIVINSAIEHYRKNSKYWAVVELENVPDVEIEGNVVAQLEAEELMKVIRSLPVGYRTVFNLYAIEGYTHKEIAETLGISAGTSKSQFSRAKEMLRSLLNKNNLGIYAG